MAFGGYPPPHHILADLGLDAEVDSDTSARVRTRVTPFVTGADGGVRAGVLATLVDVVGGAVGVRALRPDWMATADLTIQVVRPARGPFVEARGRVLRRGRTTLVIEAGVFEVDGDGSDVTCGAAVPAPAAWATMTPGGPSTLAKGSRSTARGSTRAMATGAPGVGSQATWTRARRGQYVRSRWNSVSRAYRGTETSSSTRAARSLAVVTSQGPSLSAGPWAAQGGTGTATYALSGSDQDLSCARLRASMRDTCI